MELRKNSFKAAIEKGQIQYGLWSSVRDPAVSEMLAGCGYDWMVLDCEHTVRNVSEVMAGLQAMAPYPVQPVVRVPSLDVAEIKRVLDVGAQTILVPYVQNADEALLAAAAVAYPPDGIRGVGAAVRATGFGQIEGYFSKARSEICLIAQVETREAMDQIEAIATTPGIDAIFIGPGDLAASLGHPGNFAHPDVRAAIREAISRVRAAGKPAGFLSADDNLMALALDAGCVFAALDVDMAALRRAVTARLQGYRAPGERG